MKQLLSIYLLLSALLSNAQVISVQEKKAFSIVNEDENVIQNTAQLDEFFEKLLSLKKTGKGTINIVHIGDSHIQADFLTDVVRKNLQREFGNAGRGLIVPARLAGTNEPLNIKTTSVTQWKSKRCIYLNDPMPIGIGGITLHSPLAGASINILMRDQVTPYTFNHLTLFYQRDVHSYDFLIKDSSANELAVIKANNQDSLQYCEVILDNEQQQISIEAISNDKQQNNATIFGINLSNGKDGILYHAIGVNGAKYAHYNAAKYFSQQTQGLSPDLFIISLGTNESVDYPYLDKNFNQQINSLLESLRKYNPMAKFILVTPPESFRKKTKFNPGIQTIRNEIIQYAVENGLPFWDMYKINGGSNAAAAWRMQGLLRDDGIHFTKEGYIYQGNLLFEALMKGYNQYVPNRHP